MTSLSSPTLVHRPFRRALAVPLLIAVTGCADAVTQVGDGPTPAATKLDHLAQSLAARFTNPERSGRFETARRRLVGGALHPSRVYGDTLPWSSFIPPSTRVLSAAGGLTERGYRFEVEPERSTLAKLGDTRHFVTLRKLGEGEYAWNTDVDFAMGSITSDDVAGMLVQLLTAGHGRDPAALRVGAMAAFPRSAAVLSRLVSIDSLSMRPGSQETSIVHLTLRVHTEILRNTAPHFADYLAKYVEKSRFRFSLADKGGALFFEATGGNRRINVRYRVRGGAIVSYLGPPRPLPDSLRLTSDLTMRVKIFEVGWKNLVTDFTIDRGEHWRSWSVMARAEPEWQLPMSTARLIRTPLRRPFQGAGASFQLVITDSSGSQSVLARRAHLEVKESAILRFLSSIVGRVFEDLDAAVEREEAAYVHELVLAFQADARGILAK